MTIKSLFLFLFTLVSFHLVSQEAAILTEKPVRGVYRSAYEFLNNAPSIKDSLFYNLEERKGELWDSTFSVTPIYAKSNRLVRNAWGFSDGESTFVYHQSEFFKITMDEGKISFFAYPYSIKSKRGEGVILTILGGIGGGVLGYRIISKRSLKRRTLPNRWNSIIGAIVGAGVVGGLFGSMKISKKSTPMSNRKWKYHINPTTGTINSMPIKEEGNK